MIVVASILSIFLIVFYSFGVNRTLENSVSHRLTYSSVHNSINQALRNAMSGYWGISVSEWIKDEKTLLPEDFVVFFSSSHENNDISWSYSILETQNRESGNLSYMRVISKQEIEYPDPNVYLKNIVLKSDETDPGTQVANFSIWFKNPTGKTSFYFNDDSFVEEWNIILSENSTYTINEFITPNDSASYNVAELIFYNINEDQVFSYILHKDKQFYIDLE